jgi:hypothetical protein
VMSDEICYPAKDCGSFYTVATDSNLICASYLILLRALKCDLSCLIGNYRPERP